ncbi:olfactory receptor 2H2-like [Apodemus sylvaticus]|uniref:olfactory receptor 2H2-like n=1 Tax=Apodemus sylvaticus TaxID=10129 RepID=UPI002244918E|nr:olfactory receptor 2H2-like [Apodemus sylvaticus]XP_052019107.1 olfactory receptor 2H2-like [Apodemus sylvaticus]XP_052019108.1 olfactory receptor 2H2-like [Apodemus sylvaticus]
MGTVCNDTHGNFILRGFSDKPCLEKVLFGVILVFYCLTLAGNTIIIFVSSKDPKLQIPMYFFLSNLSLLDICFTSSCVPQMLVNLRNPKKTITYSGCATQLYIFLWLGATDCVLLVVMAVDRYVAVCHPLRYVTVMHPKVCLQLAVLAWGSGLVQSLIQSTATLKLPFCSQRVVDDIVCEVPALIQLSSADTTYNEVQMSISSVILLVLPLAIILSSYGAIVKSVLKIKSPAGQRKAFGTCTSHLLVVSLFYGTVTGVYLQPKTHYAHEWGKFLTLFYTVITPTLNPLIYTLKNKEVKEAVIRLWWKTWISTKITKDAGI